MAPLIINDYSLFVNVYIDDNTIRLLGKTPKGPFHQHSGKDFC